VTAALDAAAANGASQEDLGSLAYVMGHSVRAQAASYDTGKHAREATRGGRFYASLVSAVLGDAEAEEDEEERAEEEDEEAGAAAAAARAPPQQDLAAPSPPAQASGAAGAGAETILALRVPAPLLSAAAARTQLAVARRVPASLAAALAPAEAKRAAGVAVSPQSGSGRIPRWVRKADSDGAYLFDNLTDAEFTAIGIRALRTVFMDYYEFRDPNTGALVPDAPPPTSCARDWYYEKLTGKPRAAMPGKRSRTSTE